MEIRFDLNKVAAFLAWMSMEYLSRYITQIPSPKVAEKDRKL